MQKNNSFVQGNCKLKCKSQSNEVPILCSVNTDKRKRNIGQSQNDKNYTLKCDDRNGPL